VPGSSAAALWSGRGGLEPTTGAPLIASHAHAAIDCIGCHKAGPAELTRGAGHAFRVDPATCRGCHAKAPNTPALQQALDTRARELWDKLVRLGVVDLLAAPHAALRPRAVGTPLGRAAFDVLLVIEDRAAASHGSPYARALLDAAERAVEAGGKHR
jgi:hypothetical protein